jgi:hypothetical protein
MITEKQMMILGGLVEEEWVRVSTSSSRMV